MISRRNLLKTGLALPLIPYLPTVKIDKCEKLKSLFKDYKRIVVIGNESTEKITMEIIIKLKNLAFYTRYDIDSTRDGITLFSDLVIDRLNGVITNEWLDHRELIAYRQNQDWYRHRSENLGKIDIVVAVCPVDVPDPVSHIIAWKPSDIYTNNKICICPINEII